MEMVNVKLENLKDVLVKQSGFEQDCAIGTIGNDSHLYLINRRTMTATRIPDKYQDTEVTMYPPRGGYTQGLLMVSRNDTIKSDETKALYGKKCLWGWVDESFNEVIANEYIYAENFINGKAIVCKDVFSVSAQKNIEFWGIIDHKGKEIVRCKYDEINKIIGTDRYFLVHAGGWDNGSYYVVDSSNGKEILELNFKINPESIFSDRYMLNDDVVVFTERYEGVDYYYAYSISNCRYIQYGEKEPINRSEEEPKYRFNGFLLGSLVAAC